jgi:hypothetical protein
LLCECALHRLGCIAVTATSMVIDDCQFPQ